MEDISFLGGLFDVEIKAEHMPIQIDIRKTLFYKWGEKEGEKRGIVKGLKKAILLDIKLKFGSPKAEQIKKLLDKINDINRLEKIKKEVIRAENWDDFFKVFRNRRNHR